MEEVKWLLVKSTTALFWLSFFLDFIAGWLTTVHVLLSVFLQWSFFFSFTNYYQLLVKSCNLLRNHNNINRCLQNAHVNMWNAYYTSNILYNCSIFTFYPTQCSSRTWFEIMTWIQGKWDYNETKTRWKASRVWITSGFTHFFSLVFVMEEGMKVIRRYSNINISWEYMYITNLI